ncbi:MAG: oligosaccharide flippase family protein, partial [Patescibacteria group bacterium]
FVFWVLVTHTYDTVAVGLATTLLSVSGLLSLLGLAGFDTTFVRFLPGSDRKNEYINSGFIVVTIASACLAVGLGVLLPVVSPSFSMLGRAEVFAGFVFFTVVTALNIVTNAVFLAFKEAKYILIINTIFSVFKVALPLLALGGGAMMIFSLAGSAQLLGLVLSIVWMKREFGYRFSPRLHVDALRLVRKFSLSVYASSVLNLLPPTLLPLIIVYHMGPSKAAYYYMAFTIAGVLYTIAYASMQSVFAEGSHDEVALRSHIIKAAKFVGALLLPAALLTAVASSLWLTAFGQEYARSAAALLQLFALGALPVAVYSALGAIFKVTKDLRGMVGMNVAYATVILGLSYVLVPRLGIVAVGWAWIIGNTAAAGIGALFLINSPKQQEA